jgi:hypothetical protein
MHPTAPILAFDRETLTIAALWSMIVASAFFLVGVFVLYRRERRRNGARAEAETDPVVRGDGGEGRSADATAPFAVEERPGRAIEAPAGTEPIPPEPE